MNTVVSSIDLMADATQRIASTVRNSMSKIPVLGHLFKDNHMGVLQNSVRNQSLVALSKPQPKAGRSFIYGNL